MKSDGSRRWKRLHRNVVRAANKAVLFARTPAVRTIAFKAFWMMHSEAQIESGLTPTQYANAHRLPVSRECDVKAARSCSSLRRRIGARCSHPNHHRAGPVSVPIKR